jgi:VWFA-related protein
VRQIVTLATMILTVLPAFGQSRTSGHELSNPILKSTSTLVIVPTLVRSASGQLVTNLDAHDFRLSDNGIGQQVSLKESDSQPFRVVVLMQTGGLASNFLQDYANLDVILEKVLDNLVHEVALVTFDSRPEEIWPFPPSTRVLYEVLTHPNGGDRGAAVIDAVSCAIGLLQQEPEGFRRIILLLSQSRDDGSNVKAEDVVRRLGESHIMVYSLVFSTEKAGSKDHSHRSHHGSSSYQMSQDEVPLIAAPPSTPLNTALKAMREDSAVEIAALSGGEHVAFLDKKDLEGKLLTLAEGIRNRYALSFHPSSDEPGFHRIAVEIINQPALKVVARTSYWLDE